MRSHISKWYFIFFLSQLVKTAPTFLKKPADEWANDDSSHRFSRILGSSRPSESTLSRAERLTFAQLRSGQCHLLDYQLKIVKSPTAICPECRYRWHTVEHHFTCDARPTNLTMRDYGSIQLWPSIFSALSLLSPSGFNGYSRPPAPAGTSSIVVFYAQ